jgi:hypothetical protein
LNGAASFMAVSAWSTPARITGSVDWPAAVSAFASATVLRGLTVVSASPLTSSIGGASLRT